MTAFGAPTRAIPIDGVGKFDGVMLGAFRRPRIEGRFTGSEMRAWDVNWGEIDGDFVVENSYANISRAVIRSGLSRMDVTGQFSLGYPRADGGEGDRRAHPRHRAAARRSARGLRSAGLRRRRHVVRRLPRLRRIRAAARLRQHDDRARRRLRRAVLRGDRRRCSSRATACASTASRCTRAAARSMARPTSAGTAPIRSTSTAATSRSTR